ncbi:MAG: DNA mismatch repair endonuclease MutL [Chloroflexi bacterium]|nr:DNA mismatch repair endonuclease MutL [Chloroflexota bacterium]
MSKIHVLSKSVADRIAAGEVVERPASIVKELIENAIDAGATAISVEIREGGLQIIRVGDNGSGMTRDDAALAVERFATSKITSERDLQTVRTLGFRGEALPSIAAVSQFEMLTRAKDEIQGTRVRVVDGKTDIEIAGAPIGTLVTARELFYNVPARKKFLKAPLRETELVTKTVVNYALAYPQIGFRLLVDGKESLVAPASTPLERIGAVWSREAASEMIAVEYDSVDLRVRGFISKPSFARASREWIHFYANGRPIRSGLLVVMLERPYAGRIGRADKFPLSFVGAPPPNRHPLAVIRIELDPQFVDVNVHPRKAEVRFFQERAIYGAVQQAVEHALRDFPITQIAEGAGEWPFANTPEATFPALREAPGEYRAGTWRALGQIHNTYLLAQTPDGFVIVDQHAAQEQIFFERLTGERERDGEIERGSENPVTLFPREAELVNAHLEEYRALGVEIEPFGANTFRVNALPDFVKLSARHVLDTLVVEHDKYRALEGDALRDKLASKLACVSALKAGDALTLEQQQQLLNELLEIYSPATCPHGRPTFVYVTLEELERRFLRR